MRHGEKGGRVLGMKTKLSSLLCVTKSTDFIAYMNQGTKEFLSCVITIHYTVEGYFTTQSMSLDLFPSFYLY